METDVTCADATKILSDNGVDQIPVVNSDGFVGTYNTYTVHVCTHADINSDALVEPYNTYMYVHIKTLLFTFFCY